MSPLLQTILALAILAGSTVLAFMGRINPDAVIALYSSVLGYVFGVAVPSPAQRSSGNGGHLKP